MSERRRAVEPVSRRAACAALGLAAASGYGAVFGRRAEIGAAEPEGAAPAIVPLGDDRTIVVAATSLPASEALQFDDGPLGAEAGRRYLQMHLLDEERKTPDATPIFGRYEVRGKELRFYPRFALVVGAAYIAKSIGPAPLRHAVYSKPYQVTPPPSSSPERERAHVVGIHPYQSIVPANVLKFYLVFSEPMREGREVLERIQLLDGSTPLDAPWRDLELWNAERTRLSLFLHPGRIKRGVNLREEFGPLLQPNRDYQIVVPRTLRDAAGRPLREEFRHRFSTTDELQTPIDAGAWKIVEPPSEATSPLLVALDRDLDVYQVPRGLTVRDAAGRQVAGRPSFFGRDRRFLFYPQSKWRPGEYVLDVAPTLEDLCGNTPLRAFDHELKPNSSTNEDEALAARLKRCFTVK